MEKQSYYPEAMETAQYFRCLSQLVDEINALPALPRTDDSVAVRDYCDDIIARLTELRERAQELTLIDY